MRDGSPVLLYDSEGEEYTYEYHGCPRDNFEGYWAPSPFSWGGYVMTNDTWASKLPAGQYKMMFKARKNLGGAKDMDIIRTPSFRLSFGEKPNVVPNPKSKKGKAKKPKGKKGKAKKGKNGGKWAGWEKRKINM